MNLPKARTANIVEQNIGKEVLLYDLTTNKAFNLSENSALVYKACDGKTSYEEFIRKHRFAREFLDLALNELKRNYLLVDESGILPYAGTSRRELIKKAALASTFSLPMISVLAAPTAIMAQSRRPCAPLNCVVECAGNDFDVIVVNGCRRCQCNFPPAP